MVSPGESLPTASVTKLLSAIQHKQLKERSGSIYLISYTIYDDIFGKRHTTMVTRKYDEEMLIYVEGSRYNVYN
jgi:hypothetical protein